MPGTIEIYISYATKDEDLLAELEQYLIPLERGHLITYWHKGKTAAGLVQEEETARHLNAARIILLLISPAFRASDDCDKEMLCAMERHQADEARVIPVILRPVDWQGTPFGTLTPLPTDKRPVTSWPDRDQAFLKIAEGIRKVVKELTSSQSSSSLSSDAVEGNASDDSNTSGATLPQNGEAETSPAPGTTLCTYDIHSNAVVALAWSPDGTRIVSGGADSTARVWNAVTGQHLLTYHDHSDLLSTIGVLSPHVRVVAWSCDSTRIASVGDGKTVHVWEAATGRSACIYRGHAALIYADIHALAWSPDGTRIASACEGASINIDRKVHVWDAATGRTMLRCNVHANWLPKFSVRALAWSPDGTRIASACRDKTIQVLNTTTGDHIATYHGHSDWISAVAWSPDSRYVASASGDHTVRIWNTTTGATAFTYHGHAGTVRGVAWSPDGSRVASASHDKTVQIWNAVTGEHIFTYDRHRDLVYAVTWSPDGTRIASAGRDKTVQVWQAE